jgi:hypothetical protein
MSKLIDKTIEVIGCQNCLLRSDLNNLNLELNQHCRGSESGLKYTIIQEGLVYNDPKFRHPDCPLNNGGVLIVIKK